MKNKKGRWLIASGMAMLVGAAGLTAYNLLDEERAQQSAAQTFGELQMLIAQPVPAAEHQPVQMNENWFEQPQQTGTITLKTDQEMVPDQIEVLAELEIPDYVLNPKMDLPVVLHDGEEYVGTLQIPALDLELPVMNEWSYPRLKKTPCRYVGTAYQDNMVISAHNYDSHFGRLKELREGNRVVFTDVDGNQFRYEVVLTETLQPTDIREMTAGEYDLTLFTCTIGGRQRVTVRCDRVSSAFEAVYP